jgi:ribosomal protein S12 methylthiotransferase accessory factor
MTGKQAVYPVALAGIAAHRDRSQAETAALLELIERDATMLWWYGGRPSREIVNLPMRVRERLESGVPATIRLWYLLLDTDLPVPVCAACLYDEEQKILVTGFAARTDLAEALYKAAAEAWQLRRLSLFLLDQNSIFWQEVHAGRLPAPTIPYRADRRYAQAFRPDFADMNQLAYHLQYYLDEQTHPEALARLVGTPLSYEQAEVMWGAEPRVAMERCLPALIRQEYQIVSVDLTTPDMRACGFVVVRVVCPDLVGNYPAAFLPLDHPRLQATIRRYGGCPYRVPMPHA